MYPFRTHQPASRKLGPLPSQKPLLARACSDHLLCAVRTQAESGLKVVDEGCERLQSAKEHQAALDKAHDREQM